MFIGLCVCEFLPAFPFHFELNFQNNVEITTTHTTFRSAFNPCVLNCYSRRFETNLPSSIGLFVLLLLLLFTNSDAFAMLFSSQQIYIYATHIYGYYFPFLTNKIVRLMSSCQTCSIVRTYVLLNGNDFLYRQGNNKTNSQTNFLRTVCLCLWEHLITCSKEILDLPYHKCLWLDS